MTGSRRASISILAFDLSDNATGRADLLARLLLPRYDVTVVGPHFGDGTWVPAASSPARYASVPGARLPAFLRRLPGLVALAGGDVLLASKPRPTSYGIALLARLRRRRPLVLDIDDWELGFFYHSPRRRRIGRFLNLGNPNGLPWTWLMERLVGRADAITVASRFLEQRFGGALVPHVRDTDVWDPDRLDRAAARKHLAATGIVDDASIDDGRIVMFLGTPRAHKGVDDLVDAVGAVGRGATLVIVGADLDRETSRRWSGQPWVRLVGKVPFDDIPSYLIAADVVVVPQRATSDTVGQVPAKLFDAMALGRPIVSTRVSMIPEILEGCGVLVPPGDVPGLRDAIGRLLDDPAEAEVLGRRARARCRERYSFAAARAVLFPLIDRLLARR